MAKVTCISCQIVTGDVDGAGTDGRVYLGVGGREFRLDSREDDYERGSWREYVLGVAALERELSAQQLGVLNPKDKDPTLRFPLDTDFLRRAPVYVRFEPQHAIDNWNLIFAAVFVYSDQFVVGYSPPREFQNLWLGQAM